MQVGSSCTISTNLDGVQTNDSECGVRTPISISLVAAAQNNVVEWVKHWCHLTKGMFCNIGRILAGKTRWKGGDVVTRERRCRDLG